MLSNAIDLFNILILEILIEFEHHNEASNYKVLS